MIALSKTPHLTQEEMSKRCDSKVYYVDVNEQVLGRVASIVAFLLQNKLDPSQSDHHVSFSKVIVYNLKDVVVTGKKERAIYSFPSTYAVKSVMFSREEKVLLKIFRHAVIGMLPKNRSRRKIITHLFLHYGKISDELSSCSTMNIMNHTIQIRGSIL